LNTSVCLSISILNADFSRLAESLKAVDSFADSFHIDIMDGTLTPSISFGSWIIPVLHSILKNPLEVHLYIRNPVDVYAEVLENGASKIIVDSKTAGIIFGMNGALGRECIGMYLLPSDQPENIDLTTLKNVSLVNVITVNSLEGGQQISWDLAKKILFLNKLRNRMDLDFRISVDGGINEDTIDKVLDYPVDQVVIGSAILRNSNPRACAARIRKKLRAI